MRGALAIGITAASLAGACGGGAEPMHSLPVPAHQGEQRGAIDQFGQTAFRALAVGRPARLLIDDENLRRVTAPNAATRWAGVRAATTARLAVNPADFEVFQVSTYTGVCLQGARLEPTDTAIGLSRPGWVFDRALVVAQQPGGRRLASWVEGTFVLPMKAFSRSTSTAPKPLAGNTPTWSWPLAIWRSGPHTTRYSGGHRVTPTVYRVTHCNMCEPVITPRIVG